MIPQLDLLIASLVDWFLKTSIQTVTKLHRSISAFISFPASVVALGWDPFFRPCHHSLNEWMAGSLRNGTSARVDSVFDFGALGLVTAPLPMPSRSLSLAVEWFGASLLPDSIGKAAELWTWEISNLTLSPRRLSLASPLRHLSLKRLEAHLLSFLTRIGTRHPPLADLFLWSWLELRPLPSSYGQALVLPVCLVLGLSFWVQARSVLGLSIPTNSSLSLFLLPLILILLNPRWSFCTEKLSFRSCTQSGTLTPSQSRQRQVLSK